MKGVITQLLLLFYVALVVSANGDLKVPCRFFFGTKGCKDGKAEGVSTSCDGSAGNSDLTQFPESLVSDTVSLSFVNYKFTELLRNNFTVLFSLECLNIIDSGITKISGDAFADLTHLLTLELRKTMLKSDDLLFLTHPDFKAKHIKITESPGITKLDFVAPEHFETIKSLVFDDNAIESIHPNILRQLNSIKELSLRNNKLKQLDWELLMESHHLGNLNLAGNLIQTIPESVKDLFEGVFTLHLGGNPLHCNCKLSWLKDFYMYSFDKELDLDFVECISPERKAMSDIQLVEFTCSAPSDPIITWKEFDSGENGLNYIVNCSSVGNPSPEITLVLADKRKLITPPNVDLSLAKTYTPKILSSYGDVLCEARNSEGIVLAVDSIPGSANSARFSCITSVLMGISTYILSRWM